MNKRPIVGLDLIRFGAAFLVMMFHLAFFSWWPASSSAKAITGGSAAYPELVSVSWFGWVGVQIFFVLSGFVITYSAGSSAYDFFRSRMLRLLPGAWVCATMTVTVLAVLSIYPPWELAERYTRTVFFMPDGPWVDGVYWTLAIEIVFYILIWVLLLAGKMDRLSQALIALGLISSGYWVVRAAFKLSGGSLDFIPPRLAALTLLVHGCLFALGGLLWINLCRNATWQRWATIAVCTGAGVLMIGSEALNDAKALGSPILAAVPVAVWLMSLCLIYASVRWNDRAAGWIDPRLTRALGIATYPLYLLHDVIGAAIMRVGIDLGVSRWGVLAAATISVITLSLLIATYIEKPVRSALAGILDQYRNRKAITSANS